MTNDKRQMAKDKRPDQTLPDQTGRDKTRQDELWHTTRTRTRTRARARSRTRQDKARLDETRQDKT